MFGYKKNLLGKYVYFTALSLITSLGNMGVVYMINRIIRNYFTGEPLLVREYLFYFLLSITVFFTGRWVVSIGIISLTQGLLRKTRIEVLQMVLRSSYSSLVKNKGRIFTALTRDTENVVNASVNIVDIVTNAIVILICFIYMGTMAWQLLLCLLVVVIFTMLIYLLSFKKARQLFKKALTHNDNFVKYLNEILSGFKEIAIEREKGKEIAEKHVRTAIDASSLLYQRAQVNFLNNKITGQIAFYVFIALLLLVLGELFGIPKVVLVNFIFLVLYVWGPVETVVLLIPSLFQANISLKRLASLEVEMRESQADIGAVNRFDHFDQLVMEDITYQYKPESESMAKDAFAIGPIDFHLKAGEAVFISGGNGSGKTTFVHILVGLFNRDEGDISVNNTLIDKSQLYSYRSLFAPVFSNFHLFDECYGIPAINGSKAREYLKILEIDDKVVLEGQKFSTIDLSTGQRKRVALLCAMLEQKPILILDEFAAEQDPYFKRKFYTEIIPYIKSEGFTIVAITHDDNYYRYCDRLYKMDAGKIYKMDPETNYQPSNVTYD